MTSTEPETKMPRERPSDFSLKILGAPEERTARGGPRRAFLEGEKDVNLFCAVTLLAGVREVTLSFFWGGLGGAVGWRSDLVPAGARQKKQLRRGCLTTAWNATLALH